MSKKTQFNFSGMKGKQCFFCNQRKLLKGGKYKEDGSGVKRFKCKDCCDGS